ncbi:MULTISPECIES: FAD-binding oxidoreductase [unclassified Variovorax]|uniref:FAD-binding oxidoreductase n=1 Tax=unclassified Variovorax TaxID=663243 RepID=UPI00076C2FF0|nr:MULTISPECIES: FAD-binding oxidoreductase [unclassified Variovorax]KWT69791.1 FAD/FMN-containing dehydrogenase [Variovorax sp. WDL1]PNG53401.1 putative FAD-linked oxidoreductase [Variovorax sp. B2]VTV11443.1 putative FAD-linked oxidoreductase [Variovorax sp. WDL1]
MNAPASAVEQLHLELPELDWITDESRIARLSQDFSWFSPVLQRQLKDKRADAVVRPRTEDEIRAVVSACVRRKVPITIRGSGTGNYGQTTPLAGGVVLDMTGYNAMRWVRPGLARAQAGIRLGELERHTRPSGQELRCVPSTYRSATLGGLFGGGFGGVGSINYGPLGAAGNVLGVRAMTIEAEPQVIELRGAEALRMHHLWGTNGLVLELEVGLAPAHPWLESLVVFEDFDAALAFADGLAHAPGMVKREIAFFASPVPDHLAQLAEHLPQGCHAVLSLVAESCEDPLLELIAAHGGRMSYRKTAEEVHKSNRTLMEFTWNHTTLHALKVDRNLTYLQSGFTPGQHVRQVAEMEKLFAGEVMMHLEFLRNASGLMTCSGLQLVRFTTEERLDEIIRLHREHGVHINNPHVNIVEDGKAGGSLPAEVIELKKRFDPLGLLNPGKLRDWPVAA